MANFLSDFRSLLGRDKLSSTFPDCAYELRDKITKRAVLGKWLYELYQAQGEKGTDYDDETIIKRVTGFEHCESLIPIPRFYVGCDHEKYKEDCLQALSRLYDIMESRQNKLVIQKNKIVLQKHQALICRNMLIILLIGMNGEMKHWL